AVMLAVIDLLNRRAAQFEREEEPWLRLEALRALRLLVLPPPASQTPMGAGRDPDSQTWSACWWVEKDIGHATHGETRRRLVEAVDRTLTGLQGSRNPLPKIMAFGCLRNLALGSPACRSHVVHSKLAHLTVAMLAEQAKASNGLPVEDLFVEGCGLLVALAVGPRKHQRILVEAGAYGLAEDLLKNMAQYRKVAAASFVLLGVLCMDEGCAAKLARKGDEAMKAAAFVAERWPLQVAEAVRAARQPLGSSIAALIKQGTAAAKAAAAR
ncbi:unnamed protein product, partial [Polarella glacialis]